MHIPIIVFLSLIVIGIVTLSIYANRTGKKEQKRYREIDRQK
jgi:hypothetical protein